MGRGLTGLQLCQFLTCGMCVLLARLFLSLLPPQPTPCCLRQTGGTAGWMIENRGEVLQSRIRHQKAQERQIVHFSYFVFQKKHKTVAELLLSMRRDFCWLSLRLLLCLTAASFPFSTSSNSLIYEPTHAGKELIVSGPKPCDCSKEETCERFPTFFTL